MPKRLISAPNSESVHRVTLPMRGKDTGTNGSRFTGTCFCCGDKCETCHLRDAICHGCGRTGHIQRVCQSKSATKCRNKPSGKKPVHHLEESPEELSDESSEDYDLYVITSSSKPKPYWVDITMSPKPVMRTHNSGSVFPLKWDKQKLHTLAYLLIPNDNQYPWQLEHYGIEFFSCPASKKADILLPQEPVFIDLSASENVQTTLTFTDNFEIKDQAYRLPLFTIAW